MKRFSLLLLYFFTTAAMAQSDLLLGAWEKLDANEKEVRIYTGKFFSIARYSRDGRTFLGTRGGRFQVSNWSIEETIEFDSQNPAEIGTVRKVKFEWSGEDLIVANESVDRFRKLDAGNPGQLTGAWLITGRMQNNSWQKMTPGARRTMKIMSGTRFQWIAYNVDTHEFFGTGGGTYTTEGGKYKENIEFFSRDNSRVGMSLEFEFSLEKEGWHHRGKSSKGDPIDEVWTQREQLGL